MTTVTEDSAKVGREVKDGLLVDQLPVLTRELALLHLRPIFALPPLDALSIRECAIRHPSLFTEEEEEETLIMEWVGISEDELCEFEEELFGDCCSPGTGRQATGGKLRRTRGGKSKGGHKNVLAKGRAYKAVMRLHGQGSSNFQSPKNLERSTQSDGRGSVARREWNDEPRQYLQRSLQTSLDAMRLLEGAVKDDVVHIHRLCCPMIQVGSRPSVRAELRRLGAECMLVQFRRMLSLVQLAALGHWRDFARYELRQARMGRYRRYQSLRKLGHYVEFTHRKWVASALARWLDETESCRRAQRRALEMISATQVQSAWRMRLAFSLTGLLRSERRSWAALQLQRVARGMPIRRLVGEILRQRAIVRAAIVVQCAIRCRGARSMLRIHREERERNASAVIMQKMARGRMGMRIALEVWEAKRRGVAATAMQKIWRGWLGYLRFEERRSFVKQVTAAIVVQKHTRWFLGARLAIRLKAQRDKEMRMKERVSVILQRVYRGHRGRLTMKLEITTHVILARRRHGAATCIQCWSRLIRSSRSVQRLRDEVQAKMMAESRNWQEMWNDGSNAWFYYNADRNESLWEPPAAGYTKADTNLVLRNGRVIKDTLICHGKADGDTKNCADCGSTRASCLCVQCGDAFCTSCFIEAHPKGSKLESHINSRIDRECEECRDAHDANSAIPAIV